MRKSSTRALTHSAFLAALYVVLTLVSSALGLASGAIQLRLSEALCLLPVLTPSAVPGLAVGCLIANLVTGCLPWDIAVGTLATLLGALGTRALRSRGVLAALPPVLANALLLPPVLKWVYGAPGTLPFFFLTVGAGELLSAGVLGWLLLSAVRRRAPHFLQDRP